MSSIAQRPNGRWRARYRDHRGIEHARHFPTRSAARRWLDEINADQLTGRYVNPRAGSLSLAEYYDRFAQRQLWQPTTRRSMDHAVRTSPLAPMAVNAITSADVQAWVKQMVDAGLAPTTVRARVSAVRTVLAGAVREQLRHANPAHGISLPRTRQRSRVVALPTPGQVGNLIALGGPRLGLVVDLAAHAGLRLGEIRGLQVGDVDLHHQVLTISRQVQDAPGGGWSLMPPKYDAVRTVPLPRHLNEHLRRTIPAQASPEAFVVPGHRGSPVAATTLARQWRTTKQAAGVPVSLRMHDLRHYYASRCIAAGRDVVEVQHRLGHANASTTLDVYAHRWHQPGYKSLT